jgi:hypothetical protein
MTAHGFSLTGLTLLYVRGKDSGSYEALHFCLLWGVKRIKVNAGREVQEIVYKKGLIPDIPADWDRMN